MSDRPPDDSLLAAGLALIAVATVAALAYLLHVKP